MRRGKFENKSNNQSLDGLYLQEKNSKPSHTKSILLYLHDLTHILAVILLVFLLLFRVVIVSGSSMKNTLIDGDYLLLLNNAFYKHPKQGDIIVASKDSFRNGEPIVKRVIAVEGQTVDIDFAHSVVYVDGVELSEPYISSPTDLYEGMEFPLVVEPGCVFVLGDNRGVSQDSRSPMIGQVDIREIIGKAVILLLPGSEQGTVRPDFSRIGGLS